MCDLQGAKDCIWLQVVAGAAALAGRMRKSAAEQLSDALAAGDSGGLGLRDIDRLLQVRTAAACAPEHLRSVVHATSQYRATQKASVAQRGLAWLFDILLVVVWTQPAGFVRSPLTCASCSEFCRAAMRLAWGLQSGSLGCRHCGRASRRWSSRRPSATWRCCCSSCTTPGAAPGVLSATVQARLPVPGTLHVPIIHMFLAGRRRRGSWRSCGTSCARWMLTFRR